MMWKQRKERMMNNQRTKLLQILSVQGACIFSFIMGRASLPTTDYLQVTPRVVISMFNHNHLMFTCVSTNDHLFYLSDVTNGVLLKVDYVWGSKNDSNAIEKVRSK